MKDDYEVIGVNYWKEVKKDLKNTLSGFWNSLLLIHNSEDFKEIINFLSNLPYSGNVTYISLTKTSEAITPFFMMSKRKLFIVDCVSSALFEKVNTESCFFENPPSSLTEIEKLMDTYLKKLNPDIMILDSLSQFCDFSSVSTSNTGQVNNFLNYLQKKNSTTHCKFVIIYENLDSKELRFLPVFNLNMILRMEILKARIDWKD